MGTARAIGKADLPFQGAVIESTSPSFFLILQNGGKIMILILHGGQGPPAYQVASPMCRAKTKANKNKAKNLYKAKYTI